MTTPTGQISLSDVRLEIYGSATGQVDMNDYNLVQLAGVANTDSLSMSQLAGKTWSCSFVPAGGTYQNTQDSTATFTINTTKNVNWSYVRIAGTTGNVSVANNTFANSITVTVHGGAFDHSSTWNITGTAGKFSATYTVNVYAYGTGGVGGGNL